METWLNGPPALIISHEIIHIRFWMNGASTDKPRPEWGSSIIIRVKHYICEVRRIRICTVQVSKAKMWSHVKTKLLRKNYQLTLPVTLILWRLKPGFHIVVTCRWVSLTVFRSNWSIWVVGNHCQSAVFQCRWQSFMVVNGLSKLSFKWLLLAPNLLSVVDSLSGLLAVAKGILFCFHMTQMKRQGR